MVQMGMDRAIDFTFGSSPADYHLIVEFYSKGLGLFFFFFFFFLSCDY